MKIDNFAFNRKIKKTTNFFICPVRKFFKNLLTSSVAAPSENVRAARRPDPSSRRLRTCDRREHENE
jgi:hypothetical protein